MPFKPFDFVIVLCALGAVAASFFMTYAGPDGSGLVNVRGPGGLWVFPADASETLAVAGPLGDTVVEIGGNTARITSSPCANQTCVGAGPVSAPGQWSACLPNRVMLYIGEGGQNSDVDAAAW